MHICIMRLSWAVSFFFVFIMATLSQSGKKYRDITYLKFTNLFQMFEGVYCSLEIEIEMPKSSFFFLSLCLDDIQYTND